MPGLGNKVAGGGPGHGEGSEPRSGSAPRCRNKVLKDLVLLRLTSPLTPLAPGLASPPDYSAIMTFLAFELKTNQ